MDLLLTPHDVRTLAESLGTRPTKQWGQNFVIDPNTVRRIVAQARVPSGAEVLEVGPGLGSLTLGLLEAGSRVTAIEIDPVLAGALPSTVASRSSEAAERLRVMPADALKVTGEEIGGEPRALVANLPYNVAVPVLLHLLAELPSLERVLVMVQAEVADRLAAPPGSRTYGVPSVKAQWYSRVSLAGRIGRNVFWPAPRVDSGLVAFDRVESPVTSASRAEVFRIVDAAFAQRRKTLRQALSGIAGSGQRAEEALEAAGIDPRTRGERLRIEDFARVAEHLP